MNNSFNEKFKNFYIRALNKSDVSEEYLRWLNDPEVTEYLEIRHNNYSSLDQITDYVESFENDDTRFLFGIYDVSNDKHVGNISIYDIKYHYGTFSLGCMIGDKTYWDQNPGVECILLLFKFAFENLKLRKFFGVCYANHIRTIFVLKRCGCEKEAKLRENIVHNGKLTDTLIFSLTKEKWDAVVSKKFGI